MKPIVLLTVVLLQMTSSLAAEHQINPGDSRQEILDRAASGDRLVFLPGLHQHHLGKHRSMLYVDKPIEIELQAGAILKLADGETTLEATPEITTELDGYEVIDNIIKSGGQAIHCWRMSANGLVADNIRIHDNTGLPAVVANAPGGWKPPVNLILKNNRNHLSDRAKE